MLVVINAQDVKRLLLFNLRWGAQAGSTGNLDGAVLALRHVMVLTQTNRNKMN
jgi:hypothetical protein